jgi:hypothetical protein
MGGLPQIMVVVGGRSVATLAWLPVRNPVQGVWCYLDLANQQLSRHTLCGT